MKKLSLVFLIICGSVYPQNVYIPSEIPRFRNFLASFLNVNLKYSSVSNEVINAVSSSPDLESLYFEGMGSFTDLELKNVIANPNRIFDYTTNEAVILTAGYILASFEAIKAQSDLNYLLADKFKKRLAFLAGSGDNYGMIIPMRTPLASLGFGIYTDFPTYSEKNKTYDENYDFKTLGDAVDAVPLPYAQITGQVNLWTLPLSIGFRAGVLLGFKDLYRQFVTDVDMESSGFHVGGEFKALIWRNDYFFFDARTSINFDSGSFKASLKKELYVPMKLGYLGGTDVGVVFEANPGFDSRWKTLNVTPKLTFGFKMKERVPAIRYFGISLSLAYDSSFIDLKLRNYIKSSTAYTTIVGYERSIGGLNFGDFEYSDKIYYGDLRLSLAMDIFYMSISFEYSVFSKRFSLLLAPVMIRI